MAKPSIVYMVPVPLVESNQPDSNLSLRIKELLPQIQYFFVENVRSARRAISAQQLGIVIQDLTFFELHKDTSLSELETAINEMPEGIPVGVLSEAGCPGIADPGNLLATWAHRHEIPVVPLTGPSSILLTLMASGLNGQQFTFHGYLGLDKNERIKDIKQISQTALSSGYTQLFIETPFRNEALLEDLLRELPQGLRLSIGFNLCSEKEWVKTKSITEWRKQKPSLEKNPCIFALGV
jgi:16S rRNA (cytidine1402-2'-O)-methyltransferase